MSMKFCSLLNIELLYDKDRMSVGAKQLKGKLDENDNWPFRGVEMYIYTTKGRTKYSLFKMNAIRPPIHRQ